GPPLPPEHGHHSHAGRAGQRLHGTRHRLADDLDHLRPGTAEVGGCAAGVEAVVTVALAHYEVRPVHPATRVAQHLRRHPGWRVGAFRLRPELSHPERHLARPGGRVIVAFLAVVARPDHVRAAACGPAPSGGAAIDGE